MTRFYRVRGTAVEEQLSAFMGGMLNPEVTVEFPVDTVAMLESDDEISEEEQVRGLRKYMEERKVKVISISPIEEPKCRDDFVLTARTRVER